MDVKTSLLIGVIAVVALTAACNETSPTPTTSPAPALTPTSAGMSMGRTDVTGQFAPLVRGFHDGGEVLFIHTEASDAQVADMLTRMMGPKVVLVPRLSEVPESTLAHVFVFTNGVGGDGPFGFQADVFDSVPGHQQYSPLRMVNLVSWKEGVTPRELRSVEEINKAESVGEVTIERPGVVVNMPILKWPDGNRLSTCNCWKSPGTDHKE